MDFLSELGFEPTTLGYKSNALSIRPTTAVVYESSVESWFLIN